MPINVKKGKEMLRLEPVNMPLPELKNKEIQLRKSSNIAEMKKAAPYLFLAVLLVAVLLIKNYRQTGDTEKPKPVPQPRTADRGRNSGDPSSDVNRDHGFDRRASYLEYSNHAKCRMKCRHISQQEVEDIMHNGEINYRKSDLQNGRCPRYALEGRTKDDQQVRIVFAQCNAATTVVTVIDLDTDWTCHCPGDEKK